jgi:3-isopropylmalate/(R)-2-methylmalate dehydratase large subunit
MGMTLAEKILARAAGVSRVHPGDVVEPRVDLAMSHENAALVIHQFEEIHRGLRRAPRVWAPDRIAIVLDHRVPAESAKTATNQKKVREFAAAQGIRRFHDIRGDVGGICHQVLPENGYVRPGSVVVGTDSHTTTHGALGAFAFGIGATEMASVWSLGAAVGVEVPATVRVEVRGTFERRVGPKDLILHLIGRLGAEGANFRVLEFHGEAIERMWTSGRLVLCNMSVEAGATAGLVPPDLETARYLRDEAGVTDGLSLPAPDRDAAYERTVEVDLDGLVPQVACPHTVDNVKPIGAVEGVRVHQVVVGSCTNGRLDDIEDVVRVLRGRTVAAGTRLLVFPASSRIFRQAVARGYVADLMKAGAVVMNSGCGPCLGVHQGALADGEVALSTTNRNFKGRMGNAAADVYLCSPYVAAASAVAGFITDPRRTA